MSLDFEAGFRKIDGYLCNLDSRYKFNDFLSLYLHFHNSIRASVIDLQDNVEIYSTYFFSTKEDEFEYLARIDWELTELNKFYSKSNNDIVKLRAIAVNFRKEYDMLYYLCSSTKSDLSQFISSLENIIEF